MIPKIEFRYSWVYDDSYRESLRIQKFLRERGEVYPSYRKVKSYIAKVEKLWRKQEKRILEELSKISGLEWKAREISCYIIGYGRPFSDPLTVRIYKNKNDFIDTLTHELIHKLFDQNSKRFKKVQTYVTKKYKKESRTTKNHIFLHAIHAELILRFYGEKQIGKRLQIPSHGEYKKSWQIVQEEGHKNVIREFRKRLVE